MGIPETFIDEVLVGLVVVLIAWVARLIPKVSGYLLYRRRQIQVANYIAATSFDETEILESLSDYIKPQCMDCDPAFESEMRDALSHEKTDLFDYVDRFVLAGQAKHLFIFADCGMGKTSFLINYFHRNRSRWLVKRKIGMTLVSLSRASDQEEVERVPHEKRKNTVLLLDALDEDPLVLGNIEARLDKLFDISDDFRAVIITCRSQFFLSDDHIRIKTGIIRTGPTKASESKEYEVSKIYVAPFDDRRIRDYLHKKFPGPLNYLNRKKARRIVDRVPSLSVRPMLLAHIADVLVESLDANSQADIYQAMVSAWVKREDRWIKPKPLLDFSRQLALDLYTNRQQRGGEFCSPSEISRLAEAWNTDIKTDHLTGRSLLNRLSDGKFKFSHRSILEFFVAESIVSSPAGLNMEITGQMAIFFMQRMQCADGRSEECLARQSLRMATVSPGICLGYSTNHNLYRNIDASISHVSLFEVQIASDRSLFDPCVFGEHLQRALLFALPSKRFTSIRLVVEGRNKGVAYGDAYLAVWFEDSVVLSRFKINLHQLASVISSGTDDCREVCLSGVLHSPKGGVESIRWTRQTRCDIWVGGSFDVRTIERSPAVSVFYERTEKAVVIKFISGGERVGPLGSFGIVSGGSSLAFETQRFVKKYKLEPMQIAERKDIAQVQPLIANAERWPENLK